MEVFYFFSERFVKICSKRIKKVVKGIGGGLLLEVVDYNFQEGLRKGNKKRFFFYEIEDNILEKDLGKIDEKEKNKRKCFEKLFSSRSRGRVQNRGCGRGWKNFIFELLDGSFDGEGDDNDNEVGLQVFNEVKLGGNFYKV